MILVAGIPDESPTARVLAELGRIGADHRVFDQRRWAQAGLEWHIAGASDGGGVDGTLTIDGEALPLAGIDGMYLRLMDDRFLPDVADLAASHPARARCRRLHDLLREYADLAPGRILNRPADCASNHSKPYQAQVARAAGFALADTLVTNEPEVARAFIETAWTSGADVVYKSVSGVRSIVRKVEPHDLDRLDLVRWCPTQFQVRVAGVDVRVHVVGGTALAARIDSDATDYRYAARETGREPVIGATTLDDATRARCLDLAARLGLPLAGIDLRLTPDGTYVCFEVNPSPAFTYYEERADVPVAATIARHLARVG